MSTEHSMTALEWALILILALVWAGAFFFAAVAVTEVPPLSVVLIRVGGAAVILWAFLALRGVTAPRDARVWAAFFGMGLLNNAIPFSLIFWAQTGLASGVASILNATTPIFTVLIAHALTQDERLSANRALGVVLGLAGVAILLGLPSGGGVLNMLAVLAAAFSYGLASVFGKRFARLGVRPVMTAAGQVTASAVLMTPLVLMVDRPWLLPMPSVPVIGALAGLVVLSTALAYFLYFRILSTAGATNISLVTLLIPPGAILLGALFLGETLGPAQFAGLAVIGAGLVAIDGRLVRRLGWARN